VESVAVATNVSQASTICSSSLVVAAAAVVTAVVTLRLFGEEAPTAHQAAWRHHHLSLQTVHPWALQGLKMIYPATDPAVAEVATCLMMLFPREVAPDKLALAAVKWSLLARKMSSVVMAAAMVATDAMAVEMTASAAVEAT
jgi:hypothetical protein